MKVTIYQIKKSEYGILAYLRPQTGKIGGSKTIFTAWNGTEEEANASMQAQEEFELDPKYIKDGKPYESKKNPGKMITPRWYVVE